MYRIIAVDDEIKALERFKRLVSNEPRVLAITTFTNSEDAVKYCQKHEVDIAFLDINMPKIQGLRLASILHESNPYLDIVFITAYDQYALDAFRVHAFDYLLKPIGVNDIQELLSRIDLRNKRIPNKEQGKKLYVHCFGPFLCCTDHEKSLRIRFRTAKTEELFALLLQYNGIAATKEQLIDKLWPNTVPEKAANYFRVSCTYLRKALEDNGFEDMFLKDRDHYLLDINQLDCDMHRFLSKINIGKTYPPDYNALEEAANLYTAPYFQDRNYEWSVRHSIWLENEYKRIQNIIIDEYIRKKQYEIACEKIKLILFHDPFDEQAVLRLITLLLQLGDTASAKITYNKFKDDLREELGLAPSEKLRKLIEQ